MKIFFGGISLYILVLTFFPLAFYAQNHKTLTEDQLKTWHLMDIEEDSIPGISLNRAYHEILKNKKGKEIVVAILDTKLDVNHEDIKDQLWVNVDEIPNNNIDDDENGYVDDVHGWNFLGNAQGIDIEYQKSEATRIVQYYQKKYGDLEEKNVPVNEIQDFKMFQKAKELYDADVSETKENIQYIDSVKIVFVKAKDTVTTLLSKATFSIQEVDSLVKLHPDLKDGLEYLSLMMGYGIDEDSFAKNSELFNNYLNVTYSIDYNDRFILKDDPHSLTDVPYGNNILINNELDFQHSTPVSGLMAGTRNNGLGIDGISNNIRIMPVVMVAAGDEYDKEVALAIKYAVDNGADIINMSWGKYISMHVDWVIDAFKYAEEHDVLLVSAAGNDALNTDIEINYPNDNIDGVEFVNNFIMVGANSYTLDSTLVASFSNYGKNTVDIFAPGNKVFVTDINNEYSFSRGTSFAGPLVSGVAALVKSNYPDLSARQLKEIILASGTSINIPVRIYQKNDSIAMIPFSELSKSGKILNAHKALLMAEQVSRQSPNAIKEND